MKQFFSLHIDLLGFVTSFVCALHCIAVPVIFSLGLMSGSVLSHNHYFDIAIVGIGLLIAGGSIWKDYQKYGNLSPLMVGVTGIILLLLGLGGHEYIHNTCSVLGGVLLASAHYLNWKNNHKPNFNLK